MSKRTNSTDDTDDQPSKMSKTTSSTSSYTLIFSDGKSVIFDAAISSRSSLLSNFDSENPVPVSNFDSECAHALNGYINGTIDSTATLTPALYATTLHFCDFLQMDKDVFLLILTHLGRDEGPLSRLCQCNATLPNFASMLIYCFDLNKSVEVMQQLIQKIVSCNASELTYVELNLMDGKYYTPTKTTSFVPLFIRIAQTEREVRANQVLAATDKTKTMRSSLPLQKVANDAAVENTFRAALWSSSSSDLPQTLSAFICAGCSMSKELLDIEMWRAIKAGRVDVAQRILDLGGHPVLYQLPNSGYETDFFHYVDDSNGEFVAPDDHSDLDEIFIDIDDDVTLLPTTLMVAVMNDDAGMIQWLLDVAGCPVDVTQPAFSESCHAPDETGNLRALAFAITEASMEMLLSRGADPNYATKYEIQGEHDVTREKSTLLYKCFDQGKNILFEEFFGIYGNMNAILQQTGCFNEERGITENGFSLKSTNTAAEGQPVIELIEFSLDPSIRPNETTVHWFEDNNDWKELFEKLQLIEHRAKTVCIDLWGLLIQDDNQEDEEMRALQKYTKVFTSPTLRNHRLCQLLVQYGADPNTFQVVEESQEANTCIAYWPNVITTCLANKDNAAAIMMNWCQQLLVHFGANANWPIGCTPNENDEMPSGLTVLMLAVLADNVPLAQLLLEHGADPNQYELPCGEMKEEDNEFEEELYHLKQLCNVHGYYQGLSSSSYFPIPGFQPIVGPDVDPEKFQLNSFSPMYIGLQLQCPLSAALHLKSTNMVKLLKSHGATFDQPLSSASEYFRLYPVVD